MDKPLSEFTIFNMGFPIKKKYIQHGVKIIIIRHCHERIGRVTVVSLSDHTNINYRVGPQGCKSIKPNINSIYIFLRNSGQIHATFLAWQNGLFLPLLYSAYENYMEWFAPLLKLWPFSANSHQHHKAYLIFLAFCFFFLHFYTNLEEYIR